MRNLVLFCLATILVLCFLGGCMVERIGPDPQAHAPVLKLTGLTLGADTLEAGGTYAVAGMVEATADLTSLAYSISKEDASIGILSKPLQPGRKKWDLAADGEVRIGTLPTAEPGHYTFVIRAEAGDSLQRFPIGFELVQRTSPQVDSTLVGIWRTVVPIPSSNPPAEVRVTMQIDAGHTLLLSQRMATGQPSPHDFATLSREEEAWSIVSGEFRTIKTHCEYTDPATLQPTPESDCRAPLESAIPIMVSHKVWTFLENGQSFVFRKD
ncbi:MAG: hypothetical protein JWP91_4294 [Fibrobacteres bacterium]|nr:hypothetical protein [Fibrobacterota bacterium]